MANEKQISIRLPEEFLTRATELIDVIKDEPEYRYVPRLGVSFALRLAIEKGLAELEGEYFEDDDG